MQRNKIIFLIALAIVLTIGTMNVAATTRAVTIRVEGMHCGGCATSIEKKLKATPGVEAVRVSFEKREAWIKFDDSKVTEAQLREAINSIGYKAVEGKAS